jgi:hypothetical protein
MLKAPPMVDAKLFGHPKSFIRGVIKSAMALPAPETTNPTAPRVETMSHRDREGFCPRVHDEIGTLSTAATMLCAKMEAR